MNKNKHAGLFEDISIAVMHYSHHHGGDLDERWQAFLDELPDAEPYVISPMRGFENKLIVYDKRFKPINETARLVQEANE